MVFTAVTIPPIIVILFYFRDFLAFPSNAMTYVCAFLSLVMAALMQFFITYSLAMMAFWILDITTIVFIRLLVRIFPRRPNVPLEIPRRQAYKRS